MASSSMPRQSLYQYGPPYASTPLNIQYHGLREQNILSSQNASHLSLTESQHKSKRQRMNHDEASLQPNDFQQYFSQNPEQRDRRERDKSPSNIALARSQPPSASLEAPASHTAPYHPHNWTYQFAQPDEHFDSGHRRSFSAPEVDPSDSSRSHEHDPWTPASESSPAYAHKHYHRSLRLTPTDLREAEQQSLKDVEASPESMTPPGRRTSSGPDPNPYRGIREPPSSGGPSQRSSIDSRVSMPRTVQLPPLMPLPGQAPTSGSDPSAYRSIISSSPTSHSRFPSNIISRNDPIHETASLGKRKREFE